MLDHYYSLRGWDRDGVPTRERLASLGPLSPESLGRPARGPARLSSLSP